MDAVQAANSGHPGMPMGCAEIAYVLWTRHLKHDPTCPDWPNRDRFVLSAGHGSMLLYAALHLTGYDLTLDDLRQFRQWGSRTPGHPEPHLGPGVEMATGPLGQGIATAVGMALAERFLNARTGGTIDHHTYVLASDGDLMEGISHEACSLAGHQRLGKLIVLYDDNRVTIDGPTDLSLSDDWQGRFAALGWHVQACDGHDVSAVDRCLHEAKAHADRPSLIGCRTTIGWGSPSYAGTARTHGAALGEDEVRAAKAVLGLPEDRPFFVPEEAYRAWREGGEQRRALRTAWEARWPDAERAATRVPPVDMGPAPAFDKPEATRSSSGKALARVAELDPAFVSACADLAESVKTHIPGEPAMSAEHPTGRNLYCGVREHAMAAAVNGIVLHGGMRASAGTFLVFSDYCRPAIRLAALMGTPSVFVFSHDSIGLGEDGPTHQPVEHVMSLRAVPGLDVWRPADGNETWAAWQSALRRLDGPTAIVLTRQAVPQLSAPGAAVLRGGYVVAEPTALAACTLLGTGSEVALAVEAARILESRGVGARVVSLPCWEAFSRQDAQYRQSVIPPGLPTVAVEAGTTLGWERYADLAVGLDRFGASAPAERLYEEFGITAKAVAEAAARLIS
jgi:transketolase